MIRPFRRLLLASAAAGLCAVTAAGPALACAGLVTPGGNVKLLRASTLAAWADGYEHYVTSFTFEGGGAEFGSIVPLPGVPSKVERGGDWTLQRLERETQPQPAAAGAPAASSAERADEAEVVYVFLERPDEVASTVFTRADIPMLEADLSAAIAAIQEGSFRPTPSEFVCPDCPALDVVCAGPRLPAAVPSAASTAAA